MNSFTAREEIEMLENFLFLAALQKKSHSGVGFFFLLGVLFFFPG